MWSDDAASRLSLAKWFNFSSSNSPKKLKTFFTPGVKLASTCKIFPSENYFIKTIMTYSYKGVGFPPMS